MHFLCLRLLVVEGVGKTYREHRLYLQLVDFSLVVVELNINLCRDILRSLNVDGILPTHRGDDVLILGCLLCSASEIP